MDDLELVPYVDRYIPAEPPDVAAQRVFEILRRRRSVRMFSSAPVSQHTVECLVRTATTAPSGANKQPWRFVCVQDPGIKRQIRLAAEAEEREFYARRASAEWLADLARLGTDADKSFLEVAPWLIVVFKLMRSDDGSLVYYNSESVGLACGLLIAAAQFAGLATLTHTPSPMRFLGEILGRPPHERPFLLIPLGYPAGDCRVPAFAMTRKPLSETMVVV